jgi:hypothetical protein
MHVPEPIGKFVKDGKTRLAHTIEDVVKLKFDGWREVTNEPKTAEPASPPASHAPAVPVSLDLDASNSEGDES